MVKMCAAAMILALFLSSCGGADKAEQSTTEPPKSETVAAPKTSAEPKPKKKTTSSGRKEAYAAVKAVYGATSTPSHRCEAVDPIFMDEYKSDLATISMNVKPTDSCESLAEMNGDPGLLEGTLKSASFYAASTQPAKDIANGRDLWEFALEGGESNPCEGEGVVFQAARTGAKWLIVNGGCDATIAENYSVPDDAAE